jgi:hypothetical protein
MQMKIEAMGAKTAETSRLTLHVRQGFLGATDNLH